MRFANWLHNGQPTGAQDSSTTEDGAYTFSGERSVGPRNPGATVVLPSEDEWYKAAYYDTDAMSYFDYPAGTDTPTTCAAPGATPNTANCWWKDEIDVTDVGSYTGSLSPNGTFDQGGNVWEWNEAIVAPTYPWYCLRGGNFGYDSEMLAASYRTGSNPPGPGWKYLGFRVARVAPNVPSLSPVAVALLGGLLGGFGLVAAILTARRRFN